MMVITTEIMSECPSSTSSDSNDSKAVLPAITEGECHCVLSLIERTLPCTSENYCDSYRGLISSVILVDGGSLSK